MMLTYYYNLYISDSLIAEETRIKKKLMSRKLVRDVYLIVFPQGEQNQLEILPAYELKQKFYDHTSVFVVGIADSTQDAVRMVTEITEAVYQEEQPVGIRSYLMKRQERYTRY